MTAAPGKSCGECTMCCSALEIDELQKPAGPRCVNCRPAAAARSMPRAPQVCREFECEWLTQPNVAAAISARQDRHDLHGGA